MHDVPRSTLLPTKTVKEAIAKLQELPVLKVDEKGERVTHGLPSVDDPFTKEMSRAITRMVDGAPIEEVPIDSLVAIQGTVWRARVEEYLRNPQAIPPGHRGKGKMLDDRPVVVDDGKERFLFDGHHKTAAKKLQGATTVQARVVHLLGELDDVHRDAPGAAVGRLAARLAHRES